jgi:tRNA-dihydrouridine synthase B
MKSLEYRYYMAPMAELTTPAFRKTLRKLSHNVVLATEMISAGAFLSGAHFNEPFIQKLPEDDPIIYQLAGNNPSKMSEAAELIQEKKPLSIDINMGCPAPAIVKKGWGSKLLLDKDNALDIVKQCRKKITTCKLSVKMRSGYENSEPENMLNFAKRLEDEGVDFITLHPRYARLYFRRNADWQLVKMLHENLSIPVIGNGDITSSSEAQLYLNNNFCSGIMIGREALKSPWIFSILEKKDNERIDFNQEEIYIDFINNIGSMLPQELHKSRAHRIVFYFSQSLKFGHNLMTNIRKESTIEPIISLIHDYFEKNPDERIKSFS